MLKLLSNCVCMHNVICELNLHMQLPGQYHFSYIIYLSAGETRLQPTQVIFI